jgi:hypothetical protein
MLKDELTPQKAFVHGHAQEALKLNLRRHAARGHLVFPSWLGHAIAVLFCA